MHFQVAINSKYIGKVKPGDNRFWDFNMTFTNETIDMTGLVAAIQAGHAWTAPHHHIRHIRPTRHNPNYQTTYRVKENVIGSQLLALDCDTQDERSTFYDLLQDPLIRQHATLLHESASSLPEWPRTRVIFLLDHRLSAEGYDLALKALLHRYPFCDQSVRHAAAVFYGAKDCRTYQRNVVLPVKVLNETIIQPYQADLAAEMAKQAAERAVCLARRGTAVSSPSHAQIGRYVQHIYQTTLSDLTATRPLQGLRHQKLFTAALKVGSLQAASWLSSEATSLLTSVEDDLLEAASANGYVDDYGEDDAIRTIENGIDLGRLRPWLEPVWYEDKSFFQIGDAVVAQRGDQILAQGKLVQYRENEHWEFQLDTKPNVWFAYDLLQKNTNEVSEIDAIDVPD
jgi:hypothetical protein